MAFSKLKTGQQIRIKKHVNAGLAGANAMTFRTHRSLYPEDMTEEDVNRPKYAYLHLTQVNRDRIEATDLETLSKRVFAWESGRIVERTPDSKGRPPCDFWGWEDPTLLGFVEVAQVLGQRQALLDKAKEEAANDAAEYKHFANSLVSNLDMA